MVVIVSCGGGAGTTRGLKRLLIHSYDVVNERSSIFCGGVIVSSNRERQGNWCLPVEHSRNTRLWHNTARLETYDSNKSSQRRQCQESLKGSIREVIIGGGGAGGGGADDDGSDQLPGRMQQSVTSDLSTHISADGKTPTMVDVGAKAVTRRSATARAIVKLPAEVTQQIKNVGGDVIVRKGPLYSTAILAGVMAAKQTSNLIPLCHPLPLEDCKVEIAMVEPDTLEITCTVRVTHKTGVEMEAMTGASVAALTIYDMLKGLSHDIVIEQVRLVAKDGGKRTYRSPLSPPPTPPPPPPPPLPPI